MTEILDGKIVAEKILEHTKNTVLFLKKHSVTPKLVVIVVGEVEASAVYVGHKIKACKKIGVHSEVLYFDENISQKQLVGEIHKLNNDESVHGFIIQLPLPKHLHVQDLINEINPKKDADGFHYENLGKMFLSKHSEDLAPCTPKVIIQMLEHYKIDLAGLNVVVIGRSNIVGKPIATMLTNRDATVTICHSQTKNLSKHTLDADLIILAVGKPLFLKADMVKSNCIIIDVGIHRLDGKIVGDADFEALASKVKAITPVPGGVGPLTVACLLQNAVNSAKHFSNL